MLDVELRRAVLVQDRRQAREWPTRLCDNRDRDRRAHTALAFLDAQVRQQHLQHILWSNRLGNVAKTVDGRAPYSLLVCLE